MPEESMRRAVGANRDHSRDRVQIILFAVVLMLPSLGYWAGCNDYHALAENRLLREAPAWPSSAEDVAAFPAAFEGHFDDHFGFRSFLVGRDKRLDWLGARTDVEIQIGVDGWLFQGTSEQLVRRTCIEPIDSVLVDWVRFQAVRKARLDAMDVEYEWIIAPNKHTIHSEQLPAQTRAEVEECRPRILAETFEKKALPLVDLRPVLLENRASRILYHRTDTHWNQLGAALAVQEVVDRLRARFPKIPTFSAADYEVVTEEEPFEGNLAARLRVYGEHYSEQFIRLAPKVDHKASLASDAPPVDLRVHSREDRVVDFSTGRAELPTAIVFHDSFGFAVMELLAEHFESVRFVNFHGLLDYAMIEEERPDIVLSLVVELRLLESPSPDSAPTASTLASSHPVFRAR